MELAKNTVKILALLAVLLAAQVNMPPRSATVPGLTVTTTTEIV